MFLDPTWRFQKHGKVVVGSYDLQIDESDFESEEKYQEEFERIASLPHSLEGAELESIAIDFDSSDISMRFSEDQVVRNFANSAFDDKDWTYRNVAQKITAIVSPLGVMVRKDEA